MNAEQDKGSAKTKTTMSDQRIRENVSSRKIVDHS
jgi:hypothetical protein